MKVKPTNHRGKVVLEMNRTDEALLASASGAPFRIKNILVPIDFSDCSKKALRYAVPLAKQHGATVTLLHVVRTPIYPGDEYVDFAPIEADIRKGAEKELASLAIEEIPGTVKETTVIRNGSPTLEIIDSAKALAADLIVISTHGRTGLKHVLLGSVAEHVVREAPCPVLVVREVEREFLA
jgi:universal stress protein A